MTALLTEERRAALSEFVTARLGMRFPPDRWDELDHGAAAACRELGVADVAGWVDSLFGGVPTFTQLQTLANQLTVGETYFYRHEDVFKVLAGKLLPALARERRGAARTLRIWSAGCSTGEEPYTIAMLLHETLPDIADWRVTLLATDINSRSLAKAARGVYSEWSFRGTPAWVKQRYFRPHGRGHYELAPRIREMVRFFGLNLVDEAYPARLAEGGFDFIFCRNVLMYFSAAWQEEIILRLTAALAPGGHLVVGPCDTAPVLTQRFQSLPEAPTIYRRKTGVTERSEPLPGATLPLPLPDITAAEPLAMEDRAEFLPPSALAPIEPAARETPAGRKGEPAEPETPLAAARRQADAGHLEEALAECDRAVARDKLDAAAHLLRGCVLQELGRSDEAVAAFSRVLFLDADSLMAHFALGTLARQAGDRRAATRHFREAVRLLGRLNRGDAAPGAEGLTVARLQAVIAEEGGEAPA